MRKRILSILLTLCMVLCLVPTGVFAEGETTKKVETEEELVDALADDTVDIVRLTGNIDIDSSLTILRKVTLDLNGYVLKMTGSGSVIILDDGNETTTGNLTLVDSTPATEHRFKVHGVEPWTLDDNGTEVVCGGIITGGTGTRIFNGSLAEGGGVNIGNGVFTMTGGNIVGCTAFYGGGINLINGSFTMSDGSIVGCSSNARDGSGVPAYSGVYAIANHGSSGTFTMTGGIIKNTGKCGVHLLYGITLYAGGGEIYDQVNIGSNCAIAYRDDLTGVTDFRGAVEISKYSKGAGCGIFYGGMTAYGDTVNGLTVTYKDGDTEYAKQILQSGKAADEPDDPTKDGYIFNGWYDGDTEYDFTGLVTGKITLTAKWIKIADKTADFTASDGGAAAIALLNATKTGAENSVWDNAAKTLTLKGIYFATSATIAVKLPDGATVVLADGAENHIIGGGATAAEDGKYQKQIYVYGIYSAGALTVQGETDGTGKLYVNSGEHINNGNAWTYSVGLYADGNLAVKGGAVTAQGGKTSSADCAFSLGVQLSEGHSLSVSGGTLTGIGGESFVAEDPNNIRESFSEGIDIHRSNATISGNGRIIVETVSDMMEKGLSYGLYITHGSLFVSDSAALAAKASQAIVIFGGDLKLSGGKISSYATSDNAAISVTRDHYNRIGNANIEITGGEIECVGGIYMSASPKTDEMGILSVTNGNLTADSIYGPANLAISGGTVKSGRINADAVSLQSGSLTIREPVYKNEYTNVLYASYAIYCKDIIVSGGTLDAAWDWGEYTPSVFPADSYWGYAQPLIKTLNGTVSFGGGTVTLNTGCAGNTVLKVGTLNLSGGVRGSGYTNEDGSDTYIQKDGSTPVRFAVYPADYTKVDTALNKVKTFDKNLYKDFSAVEAAVNAVVRGKNIDEQAAVNAMAQAIEDAIAALEYKDADYSKVDEAIAKANALSKDDYKDFSAVQSAVNAVVRGKNITEQTAVDAMAKAINDAIAALEYKGADYSKVNEAIAKANALNKDDYKDFSAVQSAMNVVVHGKNITEQSDVDAMAKAIEDAIAALEYKDADYSKVNEAIAKANALNKNEYKDFAAVESAINAVARGKNITEQAAVDAMAKAIEDAMGALEKRPATKPEPGDKSPQTGDNNLVLWIALLFISGGVCTTLTVKRKKSYQYGGNTK